MDTMREEIIPFAKISLESGTNENYMRKFLSTCSCKEERIFFGSPLYRDFQYSVYKRVYIIFQTAKACYCRVWPRLLSKAPPTMA